MKKRLSPLAVAVLLAAVPLLIGTASQAATIGVNFTSQTGIPSSGNNGAAGGVYDDVSGFGPSATAGAGSYAQSNWNHFVGDWGGAGANDTVHANLVTSTGSAVTNLTAFFGTDRVKYDAQTAYTSGIGNANPNATLMNGYLDDGNNDQPYAEFDVKYDGETGADGIVSYTVVLYLHGDGANASIGRYWVEDFSQTVLTDQVGIDSNDYTGTFVSAGTFSQTATPANVNVSTGNYIVFEGLTSDTLRVRGAGNNDPEDYGRGPINAVQVISVIPEPATFTVAALGLLGLRRRRRA